MDPTNWNRLPKIPGTQIDRLIFRVSLVLFISSLIALTILWSRV